MKADIEFHKGVISIVSICERLTRVSVKDPDFQFFRRRAAMQIAEILDWLQIMHGIEPERVMDAVKTNIDEAEAEIALRDQQAAEDKPESVMERARKPPKDGLCKRCGETKPVNRLMLCYPCWIKSENEKKGWRDGQPHPPECGCAIECRFESRIQGN